MERAEYKEGMSYLKGNENSATSNNFESIDEFLQHFAVTIPDREAAVFCSTNGPRISVSWKELCQKSFRMARAFVNLGVKYGECIAVVTRTCPEWLYITFGAMLAGARVTSIVFTYKDGSDVIDLMNKIGDCSMIILDPGFEESNWAILKSLLDEYTRDGKARSSKLLYIRNLLFIQSPTNESVTTVHQLLGQDHSATLLPEVNPTDIAYLFQTSGSTGVPKLVAQTYKSIVGMGNLMSSDFFTSGDIYFSDRPFTWGGGFPVGLFIGQTRVTVSGFCPEPEDTVSYQIEVIQREKCTAAGMFTTMIQELDRRHKDLPSDWPLQTIITGGQPITKAVASCIGRICERICIGYGGTEFSFGSALVVYGPEKLEDYANGQPLPKVEVKIVDKNGSIVPRNERGELYIRSPCVFKEYLNDPEKTNAVKTPDGWYKTDDIGRINLDGCIFVEGRVSNMIIPGGMNVSPAILEAALKTCPGVQSAVVVPVSDDVMYQLVCVCVCTESGSDITETKLRDFMDTIHNDKEKLFTVVPKYYLIMDKFPEEGNGKISRKTLKVMAEEKFGK